MKTVYVVAWQYNTGAGFDWYRTPEAADKAYAEEQVNVRTPSLAAENWTAYRFDVVLPSDVRWGKPVTEYIDGQLDTLCQSATTVTGPGFDAINAAAADLLR